MPVLVLGMHRSGTSVLTRVVSLLGLEVGDDDALMGASDSNPTGHWEVTDLTELNNDLLRHLGGRWSAPPAVEPQELRQLADGDWGQRAREVLATTFESPTWVWKDPRLCLLLPFWRAVIGDTRRPPGDERQPPGDGLVTVLVVREPLEVARSLEARDGIGVDYGVALWERHQRAVLDGAAGLPALVARYDDLLADPVAVTETLHGFLQRSLGSVSEGEWLPEKGDFEETNQWASTIGRAVDAKQRHHRAPDRSGLPEGALATLEATEALVGEHTPLGPTTLDPETPNLQLAFDEHARMAAYQDLALQYRPVVEEVQGLRQRVARLETQLESVESKLVVRALRTLTHRPRPRLE